MASKIALKNNINSEFEIAHSDGIGAVSVTSKDMAKINPVDTVASLRAMTYAPSTVWLSGYHTAGDGAFGSNIFRWNPESTEADNGGTVIKLDSIATGRYELQFDGAVNVKWFGANGDGVTDDTQAIKSAVGSFYNRITIFFPSGTYKVTGDYIFLGVYKNLIGEGRKEVIIEIERNDANGALFVIDAFCNISNMTLKNTGTNTTTSMALCSHAPAPESGMVEGVYENLVIEDFGYGLSSTAVTLPATPVANLAFSSIIVCQFNNISFERCKIPVYIGTATNATSFKSCRFLNSTGTRNIYTNGSTNLRFENCAFEGNTPGLDIENIAGVNTTLDSCYFEPSNGIYADGCTGLSIVGSFITVDSWGALSNNAFLRMISSSAVAAGWDIPIAATLMDSAMFNNAVGVTPKWVMCDDSTCVVYTHNNYSPNSAVLNNGTGAVPILNRNSIVGAVSQSGGVPTGSIVERGSNSNGEYIKFADGTLIQTQRRVGSGYGTTGVKSEYWTFPVSFTNMQSVSVSVIEGNPGATGTYSIISNRSSLLSTNVTFNINVTIGYTNSPYVNMMAIGRWF